MTSVNEEDMTVKIVSLNTSGLNAAKIMTYIKTLNADIMVFQETHLCNSDHRKLIN